MSPLETERADLAETRRALRLLAWVVAAAVAMYALAGVVVREDALLTRYGRASHEIEFVSLRAAALDRDAVYGERPVVWIVGSSVTRESFDASRIAAVMRRAGIPLGVEKYAFDRGATVFVWAFMDLVDVRPGDHVVTTVGLDNFRDDWIDYHGNVSSHLHYLVSPRRLFRIRSLRWADRLDYALASAPPRSFWKYRDTYRDGLQDWLVYWFDPTRDEVPELREDHVRQPFQTKSRSWRYDANERREERNALAYDDLRPEPGQVNWDALAWWMEEMKEKGARPWVVYVPHNPLYYERFVDARTVERFDAALRTLDGFVALSQLPVEQYMDYRHPTAQGRARLSQELADLLIAAEEAR